MNGGLGHRRVDDSPQRPHEMRCGLIRDGFRENVPALLEPGRSPS